MSVYFANTTFKRTPLFVYSTKLNNICTTTKSFVNSLVLIKTRTHLININKFYSLTDFNFASIRFFTTSLTSRINNHLEQCSFTRTVRTNNTNNGTSRNMKIKIFKKKLVAKWFRNTFKINNLPAKTWTSRNRNLSIFKLLLRTLAHQFVIAGNMFLVLSLASFCPHVNPFQFPLNFLLAFRFMLAFQRHTLIFLFKPRRIISLERITFSTVKFKNPAGNFIKKVTVVSYGNYSSRIVMKMLFKPCNSFRIKMVRRFVQKKNIRLLQKKTAQCNTAAFTPRKHVYNLISRRTA